MADSHRSLTARIGPWLFLVILLMIPLAYWAYADWNDERIRQAMIGEWSHEKHTFTYRPDGTGIGLANRPFRWWVKNEVMYYSANIDPATPMPDTTSAERIISVDDAQLVMQLLVRRHFDFGLYKFKMASYSRLEPDGSPSVWKRVAP